MCVCQVQQIWLSYRSVEREREFVVGSIDCALEVVGMLVVGVTH